jgi:hypothetical protein
LFLGVQDDMAKDTEEENAMRHDLQLRWLRLKRHLRSVNTSSRALRDAARAARSLFVVDPPRSSGGLAASPSRHHVHRPSRSDRKRPRRILADRPGLTETSMLKRLASAFLALALVAPAARAASSSS